jgi:hypothetical protein
LDLRTGGFKKSVFCTLDAGETLVGYLHKQGRYGHVESTEKAVNIDIFVGKHH